MMDYEGRPAPDEFAPYYAPYIERVPEGGLVGILERQVEGTRRLLAGLSEEGAEHAYAPGKWTIKEVVGHITDTERVFGYRALRIGRGDTTELPGFDENLYVPAGTFGARTLASLIAEFEAVRQATVWLLGTLPPRRGCGAGSRVGIRPRSVRWPAISPGTSCTTGRSSRSATWSGRWRGVECFLRTWSVGSCRQTNLGGQTRVSWRAEKCRSGGRFGRVIPCAVGMVSRSISASALWSGQGR